jgi:hypothetical protein
MKTRLSINLNLLTKEG